MPATTPINSRAVFIPLTPSFHAQDCAAVNCLSCLAGALRPRLGIDLTQRLIYDVEIMPLGAGRQPSRGPRNSELAELILLVFHGFTTEEFLKSLSGSCGGEKP